MRTDPLLLVDVGNTDAVVVAWNGSGPRRWGRLPTAAASRRSVAHLAAAITGIVGTGSWRGAAIASVVPAVNGRFVAALRALSGSEPVVADHRSRLPIELLYETPETLGPDRIVNAVGAWRQAPRGAIVVDAGSAITIDLVDAQARFVGGVIAPGPQLAVRALAAFTARLPEVDLDVRPPRVVGRDTRSGLLAGAFFGAVGLIEGVVARMQREAGGAALPVIATGGWAESLASEGSWADHREPWLTLAGLAAVWELNRPVGA
jgi:type III pantothenate kinase